MCLEVTLSLEVNMVLNPRLARTCPNSAAPCPPLKSEENRQHAAEPQVEGG